VAVFLKTLSFLLWMFMMLALILASRRDVGGYRQVTIYVGEEEEELEHKLRHTLLGLGRQDRLVVCICTPHPSRFQQVALQSLVRKNPSVLCYSLGGQVRID
jgi:hypothetical protein